MPEPKGLGWREMAMVTVLALLILGCGWGLVWGGVEALRVVKS
jgi:hypothetical protein